LLLSFLNEPQSIEDFHDIDWSETEVLDRPPLEKLVENALSRWQSERQIIGRPPPNYEAFISDFQRFLSGHDYREEPALHALKVRLQQTPLLSENEFRYLSEPKHSRHKPFGSIGAVIVDRLGLNS